MIHLLIKNVCSSLPCPDCSIHASHLLASYRNYHIKDDQIIVLDNIVSHIKQIKIHTEFSNGQHVLILVLMGIMGGDPRVPVPVSTVT